VIYIFILQAEVVYITIVSQVQKRGNTMENTKVYRKEEEENYPAVQFNSSLGSVLTVRSDEMPSD